MKTMILALVAGLLMLVGGASWAAGPVCVGHGASTPYVDYVANGNAVLEGSGAITGCPKPSGPFTLTVALQHQNADGSWSDQASGVSSRAFAVSYRFARQLAVTLTAACIPGNWRIHASGDGLTWDGAIATFRGGDSGVCGSYGGGD